MRWGLCLFVLGCAAPSPSPVREAHAIVLAPSVAPVTSVAPLEGEPPLARLHEEELPEVPVPANVVCTLSESSKPVWEFGDWPLYLDPDGDHPIARAAEVTEAEVRVSPDTVRPFVEVQSRWVTLRGYASPAYYEKQEHAFSGVLVPYPFTKLKLVEASVGHHAGVLLLRVAQRSEDITAPAVAAHGCTDVGLLPGNYDLDRTSPAARKDDWEVRSGTEIFSSPKVPTGLSFARRVEVTRVQSVGAFVKIVAFVDVGRIVGYVPSSSLTRAPAGLGGAGFGTGGGRSSPSSREYACQADVPLAAEVVGAARKRVGTLRAGSRFTLSEREGVWTRLSDVQGITMEAGASFLVRTSSLSGCSEQPPRDPVRKRP